MGEFSDYPDIEAAAQRLLKGLQEAKKSDRNKGRWWRSLPRLKPGSTLIMFVPRRPKAKQDDGPQPEKPVADQ